MPRRKYLRADLARDLGVDKAVITRLAKRGMPTNSLERAREWRAANLDPAKVKPGPQPATDAPDRGVLAAARQRRAIAAAALEELKLGEAEGRLIEKASVERTTLRIIASLMAQLEAIPSRVAPELAHDDAQRRLIERRLREELRRVRPDVYGDRKEDGHVDETAA